MNNSIKEMDGKFYKKCKVVMLPTEKAIYKGIAELPLSGGRIVYLDGDVYKNATSISLSNRFKPQHLYILSDEEIEGRGYRMDMERMSVGVIDDDIYYNQYPEKFKKIIASTNSGLNLPRPSNAFLKAYCEQSGIDEVLVEYELIQTTAKNDYKYSNGDSNLNYEYRLKVAPDNTITIKEVQAKDSWNRNEVVKLIYQFAKDWNKKPVRTSEWIEENL